MTAPTTDPADETGSATAPSSDEERESPAWRSDWSLWVFVAGLVVAFIVILYGGRDQWFFYDEWHFLAARELTDPGSLVGAYNGHWVTLPIIAYRVNFALWGLDTYLPYQLPVVLLHLGSAVLLRRLIQRMRVRSWIATVAALTFAFFGSGEHNLNWGFQITLTGSLFCGLLLLLVADHGVPIGRRDAWGVGVGLVGLMTSAVFPPLVVGACVAVLLRRGLRAAMFYAVPLMALFSFWYLVLRERGPDGTEVLSTRGSVGRFVVRMASGTFDALAQNVVGAIVLALVVGYALVWSGRRSVRTSRTAPLALPSALVVAWAIFAVLVALARSGVYGVDSAAEGRYVHLTAAMFLPLVALGAEHLARRHLVAGIVPLVVLALGVPGNIDAILHPNKLLLGDRDVVVALASSRYLDEVPRSQRPLRTPLGPMALTAGWLRREVNAGVVPTSDAVDPNVQLRADAMLALRQEGEGSRPNCETRQAPVPTVLAQGDRVDFDGRLQIVLRHGSTVATPLEFSSRNGPTIVALVGPLDVVLRAGPGGVPPRLCSRP